MFFSFTTIILEYGNMHYLELPLQIIWTFQLIENTAAQILKGSG